MKGFTTLAGLLLSLTAGSIALATGGPGRFETKITGKSVMAEHGRLDGTWTVDFAKRGPARSTNPPGLRRRSTAGGSDSRNACARTA
jgi:hypothetical protein